MDRRFGAASCLCLGAALAYAGEGARLASAAWTRRELEETVRLTRIIATDAGTLRLVERG